MKTQFYRFSQNNSGGYFDVDENVSNNVYIEATSPDNAVMIFEPMIEGQSGSCPCCGSRWSTYDPDMVDIDRLSVDGYPVSVYTHYKDYRKRFELLYSSFELKEKPTIQKEYSIESFKGRVLIKSIEEYALLIASQYHWTSPDAIIHYLDGSKKQIFAIQLPKE